MDELERALNRAFTELSVNVDTREAQNKLDQLETTVPIDIDSAGINDLESALDASSVSARQMAAETRRASTGISESTQAARQLDQTLGAAASSAGDVADETSKIDVDTSAAVTGVDKLAGALKGLAVVAAASIGIRGLFSIGAAALDVAGKLESAANRTDVAFGSFTAQVREFARTAPTDFAITETAALDAVATFGDLFDEFDIGQAQAADLGQSMTELAADFVSLRDIDITDAVSGLTAALRGEQGSLETFNLAIDDTAVAQEALRLGLATTTDEISDSATVLARYSLIMAQTTDVQGDYARNTDGIVNSQRAANAQWEQAQASLGEALLPLLDAFTDVLPEVAAGLAAVTPELADLVLSFIALAEPAIAAATYIPAITVAAVDAVTAFGNLVSVGVNVSQAFFEFSTLDLSSAVRNLEEARRAGDNFADSFGGPDETFRAFLRQIAGGGDELDLFASAMFQLGVQGELTTQIIQRFGDVSGEGPEALASGLQEVINTGELATEQVFLLVNEFLRLSQAGVGTERTIIAFTQLLRDTGLITSYTHVLDQLRGQLILERAQEGLASTIGDVTEAAGAGERPVNEFTTDLETLVAAIDAGATFEEFVTGLRDVQAGASDTGDTLAETGGAFLTMAADVLSASAEIDSLVPSFVGVVDGLDGVIEHAHQAGTQINVTATDFVSNIEAQIQQMEEFEGRLTLLAINFPDLAKQLFEQGPEVTEIAKDFLSDPILAQRAEDLLQGKGTEVGDEYAAQIAAALEGFDFFSPAGQAVLNFTAELNSPANIAAVSDAFNTLLSSALVDVNANLGTLNITIPDSVPRGGGIRPYDQAGSNTTVIINNPTTLDLVPSARQAGAIIDSTRTLGRGFIGQ